MFKADIDKGTNGTYMGCWYSNSPALKDYQKEYLGNCDRDIYLIVSDEKSGSEYQAVEFLEKKLGGKSKVIDQIIASNGAGYLVWGFE